MTDDQQPVEAPDPPSRSCYYYVYGSGTERYVSGWPTREEAEEGAVAADVPVSEIQHLQAPAYIQDANLSDYFGDVMQEIEDNL